ncbi:MAG: SIS domain-containing protein [Hyphomicrobiales bacterium]|nr:SIS domain-containing protein [Hyphomicrobiales bacterium]
MTGPAGQLRPMLADIVRQPDVLLGLAARAEAIAALGREHVRPRSGGRILVSGCGDGLFAAEAAAGFAASIGLDWRPIGALDLVLSAERLRPSDCVICISMSGNVDRTVEAARAVHAARVPLLALVNGGGGRLGEIAADKLSLDLPDIAPFLCGTASYTATVAALMLLAAGACEAAIPDLTSVAEAQRRTILTCSDSIKAMIGTIPTGVRLVSAGADSGTARYGAAKFVELTRTPAWSADLEEFAHSQYWSMPTTDLVVAIASEPRLGDYAEASCTALGKLPVSTLAIDTAASPVPSAAYRVTLPDLAPGLSPIVTAVPLQFLAYHLALATGFDPNRRLHLKDDTRRFAVSRELTRRSLLGTGQ